MKYPTIHIYGATGARAAVLVKYPKAKAISTMQMGENYPFYVIRAGKTTLGSGHGSTDAWEQAAINLYSQPLNP